MREEGGKGDTTDSPEAGRRRQKKTRAGIWGRENNRRGKKMLTAAISKQGTRSERIHSEIQPDT